MDQSKVSNIPLLYPEILAKSKEIGFTMPSDIFIGTLLKSLVTSKPVAQILELGTGIGLSLSWMLEGLNVVSKITSIDNDPQLIEIAQGFFGSDPRVELVCADGSEWIKNYTGDGFDLIFADAWPGKYSEIEEILSMVNIGGFYVIDDMKAQPNWPEGHQEKVDQLISYLERRKDFSLTKMDWSTGVIIMSKKF
ncbi:MAG: class I SAM-dependent methyltransferase [Bacteroidota bacterium]